MRCPIGSTVDFVNCYSSGRTSGVVVAHPGPYSVRVRTTSGDVSVPMGLVVGDARLPVRPQPAPEPPPAWTQGTLDL